MPITNNNQPETIQGAVDEFKAESGLPGFIAAPLGWIAAGLGSVTGFVQGIFSPERKPTPDEIRGIVRESMRRSGASDAIRAEAQALSPEERAETVQGLKHWREYVDKNWENIVANSKENSSRERS